MSQLQELEKVIQLEYEKCEWVDALGYHLKVRKKAVPIMLEYLESKRQEFPAEYKLFRNLQVYLEAGIFTRSDQTYYNDLAERFLVEGIHFYETKIPIPWYRTMKSTQGCLFLYHLLLSFGEYVSEYELLAQGSLLQSFQHANLFTMSKELQDQKRSAKDLVKRYITTQLSHYPCGTTFFDIQVNAAYHGWCIGM